uniref:Rho-GAP domain-containing protein n=1 Tax=Sphenodon punctatus TaxID=8508 RepID=A0A8D0GYE7_SPHPU
MSSTRLGRAGKQAGSCLSHDDVTFPQVLKSCTEFVEQHGIVDGIYRLSGVSSNIQKLR